MAKSNAGPKGGGGSKGAQRSRGKTLANGGRPPKSGIGKDGRPTAPDPKSAEPAAEHKSLWQALGRPTAYVIGAFVTAVVTAVVAAVVTPLGSTPSLAPTLDRILDRGKPIDITSSFAADWPAAFDDKANAETFVRAYNDKRAQANKPRLWGGVPVTSGTAIYLNVTGNRFQSVRITAIRIKWVTRRPPIATAFVEPPGQKGGGGDFEVLTFDLDQETPIGFYTTTDGKVTNMPYFKRRNVTLAKDESIHFLLDLTTKSHAVKFSVEVEYEYGGSANLKRGTEVITDGGVPFAFTAPAPPARRPIYGPLKAAGQPDRSGYRYVWQPNADGSRIVPIAQSH